jgi:hypothetical protein
MNELKELWRKLIGELRCLQQQVNRHQLFRTRSKLFCSICESLQRVIDVFANLECKLECGHRREIEPGIATRIAKLERECDKVTSDEVKRD